MRFHILALCLFAVLAAARTSPAQMQYPLSAAVSESGMIYVGDRNLPVSGRSKEASCPVFRGLQTLPHALERRPLPGD